MNVDEKEKMVRELRAQGKTYREIMQILKVSPNFVSKALRAEVKKDEIDTLKERITKLEKMLFPLFVHAEEKRENCIHYKNFICQKWAFKWPYGEELERKGLVFRDGDFYKIKVKENPLFCAPCTAFINKNNPIKW